MRVVSIGAYPSMVYRGSKTVNITVQEKEVVEAAKRELEMIKTQGQKAGTDAAWWRAEFSEAKKTLESIVNNDEYLPENNKSTLMSFHDYNDEGFI